MNLRNIGAEKRF